MRIVVVVLALAAVAGTATGSGSAAAPGSVLATAPRDRAAASMSPIGLLFANEQDAMAAGCGPCAVSLPDAYTEWKAKPGY